MMNEIKQLSDVVTWEFQEHVIRVNMKDILDDPDYIEPEVVSAAKVILDFYSVPGEEE